VPQHDPPGVPRQRESQERHFYDVGFVWAVFGSMFAMAAENDFHGLLPKRTIEVLKDDTILLKNEARSQA
jgi:hypothetical protein